MTIKQQGGVFGRNPTFNNVEVDGKLSGGDLRGDSLGVGVDSLSYQAEFAKAGSPSYIMVNTTGGSASGLFIGAEGTLNAIYSGTGPGNLAGKPLFLYQGFTLVCNTTAAGNLAFPSGQGIDFSATAGTGTSELFDDYEEGTWTPSVIGATSGSMSFGNVLLARYTKVGRIVSITLYMTGGDFAAHTVSGNVLIQGLPYTAASVGAGVISVAYCNLTTADEADITLSGYVDATSLRLLKGSSTSAVTGADLLSSGTNGAIMLSIVYETGA